MVKLYFLGTDKRSMYLKEMYEKDWQRSPQCLLCDGKGDNSGRTQQPGKRVRLFLSGVFSNAVGLKSL